MVALVDRTRKRNGQLAADLIGVPPAVTLIMNKHHFIIDATKQWGVGFSN